MEARTKHKGEGRERKEERRRNKEKEQQNRGEFRLALNFLFFEPLTCKQPPEPRLERVQDGSGRQKDRPLVDGAEDRMEVGLAWGAVGLLAALGRSGDTPDKLGLPRRRRRRRRRFLWHHPSSSRRDAPRAERPCHAPRGQLRRAHCCSGLN